MYMEFKEIMDELYAQYDIKRGATSILEMLNQEILEHHSSSNQPGHKLWLYLKEEVFQLLCTKSAKYRKERALLSTSAVPAIALLSGLLSNKFGIATGTAGTLAAISLIIPMRLSVNSWCEMQKQKISEITNEELEKLKSISEG